VINEFETILKKKAVVDCLLRHYPGHSPRGTETITKRLSQDSRSPGRDLNPGPYEYKAGMLTTLIIHVLCYVFVFPF
jgi:hypothetical protein